MSESIYYSGDNRLIIGEEQSAVLEVSGVASIFLDSSLRCVYLTSEATRLLRLEAIKPEQFFSNLISVAERQVLEQVYRQKTPSQKEQFAVKGQLLDCRISYYADKTSASDGLCLTFSTASDPARKKGQPVSADALLASSLLNATDIAAGTFRFSRDAKGIIIAGQVLQSNASMQHQGLLKEGTKAEPPSLTDDCLEALQPYLQQALDAQASAFAFYSSSPDGKSYEVWIVNKQAAEPELLLMFRNIQADDITGKLIRESESKYKKVLKHSPVVFAEIDKDLRYKWIFNPHEDFDPKEVLGKTDEDLSRNPGTAAMMQLKREVLQSGRQIRKDITFPLSNGEYVYDVSASPTFDADGQVNGLVTASLDITESRNLLHQLYRTDRQLHMALSAAQAGIYDVSIIENGIVHASPAVKKLFGFEEDEQPGLQDFIGCIHEEDRLKVEQVIQQTISSGVGHYVEYRVERPDGSQVWLASQADVVRDESGRVSRLIGALLNIDARKKAEEASRESEERFRRLFDALEDAFFVGEMLLDEQGKAVDYRFLEANRAFEEGFGIQATRQKSALEVYPTLDEQLLAQFARVALAGETIHFLREYPELGRWYEIYAFPFGRKGSHSFSVQYKDVTEKKHAALVLEALLVEQTRQKDFLKSIFDNSPIAIAVVEGPELRFSMVNPTYQHILGHEAELIGKKYCDIFPEAVNAGVADGILSVIREGAPWKLEDFKTRTRGHSTWWEGKIFPLFDREGKVHAALIQTWEITERKEAEEAIVQAEQLQRIILDQMPSGVSIAEAPSGRLLYHNEQAERLLRHPMILTEDYEGYSNYGAMHAVGRDYQADEYPIARALFGQVIQHEEMRYRRGDGTLTTFLVNAAPVRDQQGRIIRAVSTFEDISQMKQLQEKMRHAKEAAEAGSRSKDEFLSTMSHEIRTPLNAVIGLTNLLLKNKPRTDQLKNLNTLLFSSRNLLNLVNDILDFSKVEAGHVSLEVIDFQLDPLMDSLTTAYSPLAEEKNNQLKCYVDENIPPVLKGDSYRIQQILNNLISNAIKFTTEGTIIIRVNLAEKKEDSVRLHFRVEDSGIGIPEQHIEHIFEKFTQADSSVVRRFGGTGLGLSITRSLLQLMGSDICVRSQHGIGSVFSFTLDLGIGDPEQLPLPVVIDESDAQHPLPLQQPRILLVEDTAINRMVVQQYLQAWWNIEAEEAVNGIEALKMTEEKAYDLLLMDIRMPQMDGIEATRILRAEREKYRHTPVIALTADISALDLHKEDNKLFSAVVTKPFDPEVLRHSILALLNGNGNGNIPEMKEDQSEGEEMRFTQPEPDFSKAEEPFEGMPDRKQKFYDMALQSLAQYRKDFLHLMEQQDIPALEAIMHKQKLLFMMLGMGSFYQEMYQLRKEMESGVAFKDLAACLQDIDQGLETVINKINFRKAQLEQASRN